MPEVMQPDGREAKRERETFEQVSDVVRVQWRAVLMGEHLP